MRVRTRQEENVVRPATGSELTGSGAAGPSATALPAPQAAPAPPPPDPALPPPLRTADRQQLLSPMLIDDLVEPDHPARAVWCFAQGLDLTVLYDRIRARGPSAGRSA